MVPKDEATGARDELRARNAELEAIFRALPDLLFEIGADGVIRGYRAGRLEHLYASPHQFLGKRIVEVLPTDAAHVLQHGVDRVCAGEPLVRVEYELEMRDGRRTFEARIVPADTGTAIAVVRDVTEQRRAEEERRQLDRKLQEAQRLESLGLLAGGIAHDLNNLLAAILGGADLIARSAPEGSSLEASVDIVRQSAWRASELSRQLVAYAGKGRMELQHVDLGALVLDTATLLGSAISKRVRLELELAAELPAVHADAAQLRQVVMNLITNASDALEGRGGRVTLRTRIGSCGDAFEGAPGAARCVQLEVQDEGCGMDEITRHRMFDPFFTTKGIGRGLGLASVLGIVRAHGGRIDVDSTPGHGTRILVTLPASGQPAEPLHRAVPAAIDTLDPGTVLVVDDEPAVREVIARILADVGVEVVTASDGSEGVDLFRSRAADLVGPPIDLAVVDMTMPSLAGDEVFHELRRIDPEVPVILISGYDERDACRSLGEVERPPIFLQKPFSAAVLLDSVRRARRSRAGARASA